MKNLLSVLALASIAFAQTAKFPGAIATDQDLLKAKGRNQSYLSAEISAEATTVPVVDGTRFVAYQSITIEDEQILVCSVNGNNLNVCTGGRGFGGTTPTTHATGLLVEGRITAWHHNALSEEVKAIEAALGVNLGNVALASHTHSESQITDLSHQHPVVTVAKLPAAADNANRIYVVTDATAKATCSSGGGAVRVACVSDGTAWTPAAGDGGGGGGDAVWGAITGTLSDQTDLKNALDGKATASHAHAGTDITSDTVPAARLGTGTPDNTKYLRGDNTWQIPPGGGGEGTVTSVGLAMPSQFTVTNSPVTTSGTLTASLNDQNANTVFAGPATGEPAPPSFRALGDADIPAAITRDSEISVQGTANEITSSGSGPTPTLSIASTFDVSGKTSTKPAKAGTSPPGTCGVGEIYFKTDAVAGQNLYFCTAVNTWTQMAAGGETIPTGTIAFFNLTSCPTNWTEYTALRGRVAVGLVASGTLEFAVGTALTDKENREVGQHLHAISHGHTVTDPTHGHTVPFSDSAGAEGTLRGGSYPTANVDTSPVATGLTVNNFTGNSSNTGTVAGTNAPYVQLLACRKN